MSNTARTAATVFLLLFVAAVVCGALGWVPAAAGCLVAAMIMVPIYMVS